MIHDGELKIKGAVIEDVSCEAGYLYYYGSYRTRTDRGPGWADTSRFELLIEDKASPGVGQDWISIRLYDGSPWEYNNSGVINGGSIHLHQHG